MTRTQYQQRIIPACYDVHEDANGYFHAVDETGRTIQSQTTYDEACNACIIDDQQRRTEFA